MKNGQIYLTAMLAAAPAAAMVAFVGASPTANPSTVQLGFNAAVHNAPLQPACEFGLDANGNCLPGPQLLAPPEGRINVPNIPNIPNVPNIDVNPNINPNIHPNLIPGGRGQ